MNNGQETGSKKGKKEDRAKEKRYSRLSFAD